MPKQTFLNLKNEKRKQITDAFLREFAIKTFDEASLTIVVKELGIAKGSIYQYFESKLDLFMYLIQECTSVKMKYIGTLKREDFPDYWMFFRALYQSGFRFDNENPLHSHFLHNLVNNLNSPSVQDMYQEMKKQTINAFTQMVKDEIQYGKFREDISPEMMGFTLYKMGVAIQEQFEYSGTIKPKTSIQKKEPVYQEKKEVYLKVIDEYIRLVRPAFDK